MDNSFTVNSVGKHTYETADNGEPQRITYATADPYIATLGTPNRNQFWGLVIISIVWNIGLWGVWGTLIIRSLRYRQKIYQQHQIISGWLTSFGAQQADRTHLVPYNFRSPQTGKVMVGRLRIRKRAWKHFYESLSSHQRESASRVSLTIAYHDDKTHTVL